MPPTFILSKGPKPALMELKDEIGGVATTDNCWTDNGITSDWFKQVFVPHALSQRVTVDPAVLFLDGHDSHETDQLKAIAHKNNIIIITFPSQCTHMLQPLDVAIFGQTQYQWTEHCDSRIIEGVRMDRDNVIPEYMSIRGFMVPETLRAAFRSTGIYPLNPGVFTAVDFEPAKSFSSRMHTPVSFPAEVPSSSPAPSSFANDNESIPDPDEIIIDPALDRTIIDLDLDDDSDSEDFNNEECDDAMESPVGPTVDITCHHS